MNPVLFNLGPIEIRCYGILFALAFLTGYLILRKLAREKGINDDLIDSYFIYLLIFMVIGARLFEILFYEPAYYLSNPIKIFYLWEGGLASHGAILAAIIVTYFFTKKHKMHFYDLADLAVIPCALGAAFVRAGNFINGELVGKITTFPTAVKFGNYEGLRHPVQLYEAFANILIFAALYNLKKLNLKKGTLFWLFILSYSVFRLIIDFFKDIAIFAGLTIAQWASIILIIISIIFLIRIKKK